MFAPGQMLGLAGKIAAVGLGFTVTVAEALAVQDPPFDTVTEYVVVLAGLTLIELVVEAAGSFQM